MRIDSIKLQGLFSYVLHGLTSTNLPDKARKPLAKCQESLRSRGRLHSIDEKGNNREAECVMQTPEQADK